MACPSHRRPTARVPRPHSRATGPSCRAAHRTGSTPTPAPAASGAPEWMRARQCGRWCYPFTDNTFRRVGSTATRTANPRAADPPGGPQDLADIVDDVSLRATRPSRAQRSRSRSRSRSRLSHDTAGADDGVAADPRRYVARDLDVVPAKQLLTATGRQAAVASQRLTSDHRRGSPTRWACPERSSLVNEQRMGATRAAPGAGARSPRPAGSARCCQART